MLAAAGREQGEKPSTAPGALMQVIEVPLHSLGDKAERAREGQVSGQGPEEGKGW